MENLITTFNPITREKLDHGKVLLELLIDKGIVTQEEFDAKCDEIVEGANREIREKLESDPVLSVLVETLGRLKEKAVAQDIEDNAQDTQDTQE